MNWTKIFLLIFTLALLMNQALSSQTMKNLLVKSGKIEYQFGDDFSGKEIFYFDDFGTKKSITENRNVIGGGQSVKTKTIINGSKKLETDLQTGKYSFSELSNNSQRGFENATDEMLQAGQFKKTGMATVAGLLCEKYEGYPGTLYVWKKIILKSEITIIDKKLSKTAIMVDTLFNIQDSIFFIKTIKQ